jgi:DNA polymerase-3 subunit delta
MLSRLCGREANEDRRDFDGVPEWKNVRDELSAGSLFSMGQPRWIVIHDGDDFVEKYRDALEGLAQKPSANRLLLRMTTFAANTRLYKAVNAQHLAISCSVPQIKSGKSSRPDLGSLREFLITFVAPNHQCKLEKGAADVLIELVGSDLGFLSNAIAKAALFAPPGGKVTESMVREHVGGWRGKSTWEVIDAAATGQAAESLKHLARMLDEGEHPLALLAQFAWSLRRLAMANAAIAFGDQVGTKVTLAAALEQAGFRAWDSGKGESQLRQLGRARANRLMAWVLDADLKLKLTHSDPERGRWVLEELFLKLATAK